MGILIDSSVFIASERRQIDPSKQLARQANDDVFLSVISASELLHGVHRAQSAAIRSKRLAFVESVMQRIPILPIDLAIARIHSQIGAALASAGQSIGPHDLWIAASALAHGLRIATGNVREFRRVPGLIVESWTV